MLLEIGMLERVMITLLAILPVKKLMGGNDRLFGWKRKNTQSIVHDVLNNCHPTVVLHLSAPFTHLINMHAGLRRPNSFRPGPGHSPSRKDEGPLPEPEV